MERQVSRHDARVLARRRRIDRGIRATTDRIVRSVWTKRSFAAREHQLHHDGFTLRDLVSYNSKHNEANLENNRDGSDNNISWNCGVEGPTDDPAVRALRGRQSRNLLATLLLSQGVPMITAGDEIARTQQGNNNAYCQDSPISWVDWTMDDERTALFTFARRVIDLRRNHPVFRRRHFFEGRALRGEAVQDIVWLKPDGKEMTDEEWNHDFARCLGVYLAGDRLDETDARGHPVVDEDFIVLFNAHDGPISFTLPPFDGFGWIVLVDTARDGGVMPEGTFHSEPAYALEGRSLVLLEKVTPT
jgi:glycogen operon protein